jgi:hypothetical protein
VREAVARAEAELAAKSGSGSGDEGAADASALLCKALIYCNILDGCIGSVHDPH